MDAEYLFSKLKTQTVPANCLKTGDIVRLDYNLFLVRSVTHRAESDFGECVEIGLDPSGTNRDISTMIVPAYSPGSDNKWSDFRIVIRAALCEWVMAGGESYHDF
jgi:hypothetical protein